MATEMEVVKGIFEDIAQLVDEQSDAVGMRSSTCTGSSSMRTCALTRVCRGNIAEC